MGNKKLRKAMTVFSEKEDSESCQRLNSYRKVLKIDWNSNGNKNTDIWLQSFFCLLNLEPEEESKDEEMSIIDQFFEYNLQLYPSKTAGFESNDEKRDLEKLR